MTKFKTGIILRQFDKHFSYLKLRPCLNIDQVEIFKDVINLQIKRDLDIKDDHEEQSYKHVDCIF